jgi:hypothetical protein
MRALDEFRGPDRAITRACHSHRVLITGDTNSNARNPRRVPRKPHPHRQIRASGPHPPTRRCCGGEIQFRDHAPACSSWSRLRARHWRFGFANIAMCVAHQSNFPAACAAPRPAFSALSRSVLKNIGRAGLRLGLRPRVGGGGCLWGWGLQYEEFGTKPNARRAFHGRIHQGRKKKGTALVAMQIRVQFHKEGQR